MKYIKLFILIASVSLFAACSDDSLDSKSIFDTQNKEEQNDFDKWLKTNYVDTYNIRFNYRYSDKETDNRYNLAPADFNKSKALAIKVKHIWLDAYNEVMGDQFLKNFSPRVMQLVGSAAYDSQSSIVMGTAEGGLKVTLYNVNIIDVDNPIIDPENPFVDKKKGTYDLNYWFFHTMNHEFCHILTQKKNYSTEFQTVSAGKYQTSGWVNVEDKEAPSMGFVSGYASGEYNEDFAEIFAQYVTHSEAAWQKILRAGIVYETDENGDYVRRLEKFDGASGTQVNPLYEINFYNSFDHSGYDEVTDDLSLNWRITDGLRLRGQFSVLMRNSTGDLYKDPASASYSASTGNINGEKTESTQKRTVIDGSLSLMYNNTFKGHNLNICLSSNMRQTQSTASETRYRGFPGGDLVSSNYAAEVYGKPSSSDNTTRLVGALLTSNYTYNNIYLADLTGRIDGSSEFGSDKRWSMFWSTGAGINFSMLKFRASYGLTGKTNFSLYSAKDMYQLQTDSWYPTGYGVFLYQMGNPNLKWERKYTLDYGVEIGLWHDKIYLKASAYDERTIDLITDYTIPSSTGFTSYKENMGKVKNTGVELELRARLYSDRNWLFQLYGSFARNKNTIIEISQAMRDYNKRVEELFSGYNPESSSDSKYAKTYLKYYEGASLTSIYGMKSLGISPTNGKEIYLRRNGDVTDVWSADEWTIIGDTAPKGQGSFGYTLSYKQLSMFASFLYTFGGDAYNNTLVSYVENADIKNDNVDKRVLLDRWQKPGDITTMKDIRDRNVTTGASSRFVQKNNTLQWSSLTMSYNFRPEQLKKLHLSGLRLSFTMNDLFYWSTIRQERGLDYPYSRSFNLTTNIIF